MKFVFVLLALLSCHGALAAIIEPSGIFDKSGVALPFVSSRIADANWTDVEAKDLPKYRAVGPVQLYMKMRPAGTCTASLIVGSAQPDAPVYLLTAGHCVHESGLLPGEVVVSEKAALAGEFTADPNWGGLHLSFLLGELNYAIWNGGLDLALYEMGRTAAYLKSNGIQPLMLAENPAPSGEDIELPAYSAHLDGNLHRSECRVDAFQFGTEYRQRCSTIRGMSGAPLLSTSTGRILGVASTSANGHNFAASVHPLAQCFDPKGKFDLSIPQCTLPKPCVKPEGCRADACDSGQASACSQLAESYKNGKFGAPDLVAAETYYAKGCALGDDSSCGRLGELYWSAQAVLKRPEQSSVFLSKGCELGDFRACANLGWLYDTGQGGVGADLKKAFDYDSKACAARDYAGCFSLARFYDEGKGVEQSYAKAVPYYEIACDYGLGAACNDLGLDYEEGSGVTANPLTAVDYYRRGCDAITPSAAGCFHLAQLYLKGFGVAEQLKAQAAADAYKKGCDLGDKRACDALTPAP